jgi:hypothetical protein
MEIRPGSKRVGRFIGRLGVVPMPAVECGLGLVDRVVRRHVAKLERVGWCERISAIRGDGSRVWMTALGLDGVGLSELPALRAPAPFSSLTLYGIRMAWAAADIESAGLRWHASRELAVDPRRWGVVVPNERSGHSRRLPDVVFWPRLDDNMPVAVVIDRGLTSARRERAALAGWHRSIMAGQYAQVRCLASPAAASHVRRVATDVGLLPTKFIVAERVIPDEPRAHPLANRSVDDDQVAVATARVARSDFAGPPTAHTAPPGGTDERVEAPEQAAARQKLINELLGHGEPARRRPRAM